MRKPRTVSEKRRSIMVGLTGGVKVGYEELLGRDDQSTSVFASSSGHKNAGGGIQNQSLSTASSSSHEYPSTALASVGNVTAGAKASSSDKNPTAAAAGARIESSPKSSKNSNQRSRRSPSRKSRFRSSSVDSFLSQKRKKVRQSRGEVRPYQGELTNNDKNKAPLKRHVKTKRRTSGDPRSSAPDGRQLIPTNMNESNHPLLREHFEQQERKWRGKNKKIEMDKLHELLEENEKLKANNNALEKSLHDLQERATFDNDTASSATPLINNLQHRQIFEDSIRSTQQQQQPLGMEKENYEADVVVNEQSIKSTASIANAAFQVVQKMKTKLSRSKQQLSESRSECKELRATVKINTIQAEKEMTMLTNKVDSLEEKLQWTRHQCKDAEAERDEGLTKVFHLKRKVAELSDQLQFLQMDLRERKDRVKELERTSKHQDFAKTDDDSTQRIRQESEEIRWLKTQVKERDAKVLSLRRDLEKHIKRLVGMELNLETTEEDFVEAKQKIESYKKEIVVLRGTALADAKRESNDDDGECNHLKRQLNAVQKDLEQKVRGIVRLEMEVETMEEEMEDLREQKDIEKKEQELQYRLSLEHVQSESTYLREKMRRLEEENRVLRLKLNAPQ